MGKPWLKLWTETRRDIKITRIEPALRWCWCGLLMLAAENDNNDGRQGYLEAAEGLPLSDQEIADGLTVPLETWLSAREYFKKIKILVLDGDTLRLKNYIKRQSSQDPTGAERQRRYKDRHLTPVTNALPDALLKPLPSRVEEEVEEEAEFKNSTTTTAQPPSELTVFTAIGTKRIEGVCGFLSSAATADEVQHLLAELHNRGVPGWLDQALSEAEALNKRNWKYVKAILERCLRDGIAPGAKAADKASAGWQASGYNRSNGRGQQTHPGSIASEANRAINRERQPADRTPRVKPAGNSG